MFVNKHTFYKHNLNIFNNFFYLKYKKQKQTQLYSKKQVGKSA